VIVYLAASGKVKGKVSEKVCTFLGETSYPLYIIHYPIMYLFYAWLWKNGLSFSQTWPVALAIFIGAPVLAYACLKLYDEPVRKWLGKRM
jgi:peptidoglycan/LPS O-acetylase OafA/YrhL